jgi:hypothetical protein
MIGTTTMDPELSLYEKLKLGQRHPYMFSFLFLFSLFFGRYMANLACARPGALVFDPFVGTGVYPANMLPFYFFDPSTSLHFRVLKGFAPEIQQSRALLPLSFQPRHSMIVASSLSRNQGPYLPFCFCPFSIFFLLLFPRSST